MLLAGSAVAQAQPGASPLARAVRPAPAEAPLTGMLAALSRQSGVPFSYSSTRIGGLRRCRVRPGPPRPLGTVLHEVAGQFRLSYGLPQAIKLRDARRGGVGGGPEHQLAVEQTIR